jgi:uncharacterized membrane protein YheB (UPF0754 family)
LEELVKRVTHRELRLIVILGYWLGGFIGVVMIVVQSILR